MPEQGAHVFISYSTNDSTCARALCATFESAGVPCWIAPRDIKPGQDWSESIPPAIDGARAFLLVFSESALASEQVAREVHIAQSGRGKLVIPVRIDDAVPTGALRYLLSGLHWFDARSLGTEEAAGALLERLRNEFSQSEGDGAEIGMSPHPTNIEAPAGGFVGREDDLSAVQRAVRHHRVVTLAGTGGVGKTTLALHAGRSMLGEFPDGVWFIELVPARNLTDIERALAAGLQIGERPGETLRAAILLALQTKNLLLLFDNCEHLAQPSAAIIRDIVDAAPQVRILTTSRQSLGLHDEDVLRIEPLPSPPAVTKAPTLDQLGEFSAVRLFLDRAQAAGTPALHDETERLAIFQIVRKLDGIPLALELAAARSNVLSFKQIDDSIGKRFKLLTSGKRDALPHHQTLEALIAWSYDLLDDSQKRVFRRSGLFNGHFSIDAIQAVCAQIDEFEVLDSVAALVDRSLLRALRVDGGKRLYRMLESTRAFALQRARDAGDAQHGWEAIAAYARDATLAHAQSASLHRAMESELDTVRTALAWGVEGENNLPLGAAIMTNTLPYWLESGKYSEAEQWYEQLLARLDDIAEELHATTLVDAGAIASRRGRLNEAAQHFQRALDLYRTSGQRAGQARALNNLAGTMFDRGDSAAAEKLWLESLELLKEAGHAQGIAMVTGNLGLLAWQTREDYQTARARYGEALEWARSSNSVANEALFLGNLGEIAFAQGNISAAIDYAEKSLRLFAELRDHSYAADQRKLIGKYELACGRIDEAFTLLADVIQQFVALEQPFEVGETLYLLAGVHAEQGRLKEAAQLIGCARRLVASAQRFVSSADRQRIAQFEKGVEDALGAAEFQAHIRRGELLAVPEAVALATTPLTK